MRRFRQATSRDLERLVSLAVRAYPVPAHPASSVRDGFENNPWGDWDDIWIGESDGEVVAQAFLYPFEIHAWGRRWPAGGLGSVAVAPDHRRRGWARDLVKHCQDVCVDRGWPFLMLYPFRIDYYAAMGWGLVESREAFRVRAGAIPFAEEAARVRIVTAAEIDRLLPVYDAFAARRHGYLVRTGASWMTRLLRRPPFVAVHEGDAGPDGYLLYEIGGVDESWLHQRLRVRELVWTTDAAWRGLWGFVRNQADQVTEVVYEAREDDGFLHHVRDPAAPGGPAVAGALHKISDRGAGLMMKILDPSAIAGARSYGPGEGTLAVTLTDPLVPRTDRAFRLEVSGGRGVLTSGEGPGDAGGAAGSVTLDTGAWSQLLCGAITLDAALRTGRAVGSVDPARWDSILSGVRWGIFEGF